MTSTDDKVSLKREVDWMCLIFNLQFALSCFIALYLVVHEAHLRTTIFCLFLVPWSLIGTMAGAHRLWAHQTYKASTGLRIFLMLCHSLGSQTSIYNWVRLHRLHHKFYQTDLDPYNPRKGFFYSHFIANNLKLSPAQEKALQEIDMSDLENDKVVMFQKRFFWILFAIVTLLLPINAPVEYWDDSILNSIFIVGWLRFRISYQLSRLIHSATTIFDYNRQDRNKYDSNMAFVVNKSYWLSYHYLQPSDYQTSEYGKYGTDCTTKFIRVCAALELATDLKTVDCNSVRNALTKSLDENQSLPECIKEMEVLTVSPQQQYLMATRLC